MRNPQLPESIQYSPYLVFSNGRVSDVGYALADLTGYRKADFIDKDVVDVIRGLLKCGILSDELHDIKGDRGPYYIFTRDGEARQVYMTVTDCSSPDRIIVFREIPGSRLEEHFPFIYGLCHEDMYPIAVYDISCLTVVKASRKYYELSSRLRTEDEEEVIRIDDFLKLFSGPEDLQKLASSMDRPVSSFIRGLSSSCLQKKYDIFLLPLQEANSHRFSMMFLFECNDDMAVRSQIGRLMEMESGYSQDTDTVSFIMHELKTPINVVISALQAMESICGNELPAKIYPYLSRIKKNVNKQLRLINSLLDISKAESGYMQLYLKNVDIVMLTRAIVESVRLYALEKGIDIRFNTLLRDKIVAIDDEKFERIMLNLLSNAIKYTPPGKSIYLNMSKVMDRICIEVRDEGLGIPAVELGHIFDKFCQLDNNLTRKGEGTGIGLSLVKNLVMVLGGEITVESEEGKGSSFKVLFNDRQIDETEKMKDKEPVDGERLEKLVSIEFSDIYLEKRKQDN